MNEMTKEQKKIIYISLIAFIFLISFWVFVYRPQSRKLISIKKELAKAESQIEEITKLVNEEDLAQNFREYESRFNDLVSCLPSGEEDVIDNLSKTARGLKIEVRKLIPSQRILLDNGLSYKIEELPISMNLVCEFNVLGEFLNILKNDFPVLIKLRQIEIKSGKDHDFNLDVSLEISAYLSEGGRK